MRRLLLQVTFLPIYLFATTNAWSFHTTPHFTPDQRDLANEKPVATRRSFCSFVPVAAAHFFGFGLLPALAAVENGCASQSDPFKTIKTCVRYGRDKNGRLRPVAADENGVSCSSVRSPSQFAAPWNFSTFELDSVNIPRKGIVTAAAAWEELKREVSSQPGVEVVESIDGPDDYYLRATARTSGSLTSLDDIEFSLKPLDTLVLFRSVSRESVFVYPLQQPVSDRGSNLQRLEEIRSRLGWGKLKYEEMY